ncbi:hypothetical protein PCASD_11525 [Puccinia coronata f. sp. avenae]|uniref:UBA domain-containing protein n=1 Tax=Puccinia coronata f. sp. avenae TaxID=200324 RepID=A0A2N5UM69_9BASI|nr:hypothetical protein PCASD_11525 [Puccinia coronata f. sp. avenae]
MGESVDDTTILNAMMIHNGDFERTLNYLLEGNFENLPQQSHQQQQLRHKPTQTNYDMLDSTNETREPLVLPNSPPKGSYQPLTPLSTSTTLATLPTPSQSSALINNTNSTEIQLIDNSPEKCYKAELNAIIEASLATNSALNKPSQNVPTAEQASLKELSAEDEQMSKALEESLAMSGSRTLEADGKFSHPPPSKRQHLLLYECIILIWSSFHAYYQPCMRPVHSENEFWPFSRAPNWSVRSLSYLQSLVAAQSQDFKTHVAQLSITPLLTTRTTGAGSFSSQPTGNATDHDYRISDQPAGLRTQYLINNLRPALNYSAWLFQPGPLVDNVQTGKLWPYIKFCTKISKNCRLVHDLPFCLSVAYAVPSSPLQTTSSLIDMYNQTVSVHLANFRTVVSTYPCNNDTSGRYSFVTGCGDCLRAYTDWVCAVGMPQCTDAPARPVVVAAPETQVVFTRTEPSASRTPNMTDKSVYPYAEMLPCASLCTLVAATCPPLIGWTCPLPGVSLGLSYRDPRPLSPLELYSGHQSLAGFGGDRAQDRFGNVFCNALKSDILYAQMGNSPHLRISVQTLASLLVAQSFFLFFLLLA